MRRLCIVPLLTLVLIAAACAGPPPVQEALRGFDGELLEPDDELLGGPGSASSPEAGQDASTADSPIPAALAFSDDSQTAVTPAIEGGGVCAALDQTFDTHFSESDVNKSPFADSNVESTVALLQSVNDGAFGAEWSRFAQVAFTEGGATGQELDREFDDDWIRATEKLAQEQCGFPAMAALLAALTPECFTPISPSGERGEQQCTNKPDPR